MHHSSFNNEHIPAYCCIPLYACDNVSIPLWFCADDAELLLTPLTPPIPEEPIVGDEAAAAAAAIILGMLFCDKPPPTAPPSEELLLELLPENGEIVFVVYC